MERFTREIRNGIAVNPGKATASEVSFTAYVRTPTCGGTGTLAGGSKAIPCQVTYRLHDHRMLADRGRPWRSSPAPKRRSSKESTAPNVFSYTPSEGPARYIEVTLRFPNPSGNGDLTISDGASLRNANLSY